MSAEAVAAAAMTPPEAAALPGGSAAQRENLKKAQQKQRESAVWRQTASCICANLAVYWRREGAEFPSTPTAGLHLLSMRSRILKHVPSYIDLVCGPWLCAVTHQFVPFKADKISSYAPGQECCHMHHTCM